MRPPSQSNAPPPDVARALETAVLARSGRWEKEEIRFRCPHPGLHKNEDASPSARYNPERFVWYCDACGKGGGARELCDLLDVSYKKSAGTIATYAYTDERGELLFEVVRKPPKQFRQRRPDGSGSWTWNLQGVRRVLYRLPEVIAAVQRGQPVHLVEGEKDADNLGMLGLVATSNPGGAGKWSKAYSEVLRGARVVIIPDNDEPGRRHAERLGRALHGVAAEVRVVELPGLPEGGDVSDWIAAERKAGGSDDDIRTRLEDRIAAAEIWAPPVDDAPPQPTPESLVEALAALPESPEMAVVEAAVRQLGERVASLDAVGREVVRESAIRALGGKIKSPARLIDAAFGSSGPGGDRVGAEAGRALCLDDPEPWPGSVDGADLLTSLAVLFQRHVVLPDGGSEALALWVLHTYAHDAATVSPLLALTSPVKRCGKTTTLLLLTALVRRPLPTSNITPAALFRAVERFDPTLLIDEADSFLAERDELRGILNSGHTRATAFVIRTAGEDHEPRTFSTWTPKAVALIGRLPSTLEDRAVAIAMRRKAPGETVERLRVDRLEGAEELRRRCARWAADQLETLQAADSQVPGELNDRAADNWRPLLAIADAAGGPWPRAARIAALTLSAGEAGEDSSARVRLLRDVREVFEAHGEDRLFTDDLLRGLCGDEEKPWGEWRGGKPLSAITLSRMVQPFGVKPRKIRIGESTRQGYQLGDLGDAFARYLPSEPEHPEQVNNGGGLRASATRNTEESVPARETPETPAMTGDVPGVPAQSGEPPPAELPPGSGREVFEL